MPLGSVEEWRARIGSSWCALGRPVKSVSGGGVTRQLSGEVMLQVLYVLMMLTLVVVVQRVRKMNMCLSGYHKELRSNIHPRTTAKRLLFIMILLLQAQSFIQSSLLLKCGDIESNPGPDLNYNNIDNSTVLTEDDFRDVYREVVDIQTTYYQFGVELGLPPRELDAIRKQFVGDLTQCFTEVLLAWLRHRYKVDRHGLPTWRRLVEAVDSPSGGNNHALAKAIASKHPSLDPVRTKVSPITVSSPQVVFEENIESNHLGCGEGYDGIDGEVKVQKVVKSGLITDPDRLFNDLAPEVFYKHMEIGIELGLESKVLRDELETGNLLMLQGSKKSLRMFQLWQQSVDEDSFTYSVLAAALEKHGFLRCALKYCYTSSICSGSSEKLIRRCRDTMAAYYLRQVDERAWPPIKAINFINLALVKDQTSWRRTVQQSVDDIIGDKENTSYSDMLANIDYSRFILLEGRPGSGKTTLMYKISCDWSNGEILKSKLVIFVPLRRLNDQPDRSLSTLIKVACPALSSDVLTKLESYIRQTNGQNVVFAFDGLDEYRPIYYRDHVEHEDVFDLLRAKHLPKSLVILTSRPVASKQFRKHAKKRLEVLGFLKEQVIEYVHHYFDCDIKKAQQLISHLEHHPNLMNMAYLPLHCAMLVFLYEDDTVLPETETEFYKHFTLSTLLRSLRKRNVLRENFSLSSFADLPHNDRRIFHMVCQLAFDATVKSYQVFKYSELKDKLFEVSEILSDESSLGLVVIDRYFMRCGHDETYTFLHLTFQEYLAAVHIARLNTDEQRLIIKRHGNAANLSVVWRFLCGMIDFCQPSVICIFASLMQKNEDLLFKVQCCYESQHSLTCTGVIRALHGELKFRSVSLSPSDCNAIGYIVKRSPDHVLVIFEKCDLSLESASSFFRHIGKHDISLTLRGKSANISCLEGLKQCPVPGLCCLNISLNNSFGDSQTQVLVGGLKHCTLLTKLDLSGNAIGSVGAQAIGEVLKHLKALENLDLGYNYSIGDSGAQALAEGLKYCTMLTNLNLGGNNIGNDGAVAVGESLQHCVCLEHLDLSINNIDSAGVQTLAENIKCCTKLKKLNFWGNELNHKAVPHLIVMITTFNSLQSLSIGEYHLNQNDKDELNKAAKTVTQGKLIIYS